MSAGSSSAGNRIRFLADQDFREAIVIGLQRRRPEINIRLVKEIGLLHRPDPEILEYAREQGRMLLTHDKRTMPKHLDDLLLTLPPGDHHPGGFLVPQRMATGRAIEELLLIWEASEPEEWQDRFTFLPL